jgi:hypothetical protein
MTWNCLGMGAHKQHLLAQYQAAHNIDLIFLQEGDSTFEGPQILTHAEAHSHSSFLYFDDSDSAIKCIAAAIGSGMGIGPMSGVSRSAFYNVLKYPGAANALDEGESHVDYLNNNDIKTWIKKPAAGPRIGTASESFRLSLRRGVLEGGGTPQNKELIQKHLVKPVTNRLNLLGHRRPKSVHFPGGLRIYYWHAPLGSTPQGYPSGLPIGGANLEQCGCQGGLAVAANALFAKHLGVAGQFPANTILLGDLNITDTAVAAIYKTNNILSSSDGWCHVVAPPGLALNLVTNDLDQTALGYSDHAPIVFDV